jgi:hypothetical protein
MVNNINFEKAKSVSFVNKNTHDAPKTVSKINNDFDSLTKFLKENGVSDDDIKSLEDLIEIEGKINLEKGYGKEVKEWITNMISKSI